MRKLATAARALAAGIAAAIPCNRLGEVSAAEGGVISGARYRVKAAATAGVTVRSGPHKQSQVMRRLKPGDSWEGETIEGDTVTVAGFGSGKLWIRNASMLCVWAGLLEEVK